MLQKLHHWFPFQWKLTFSKPTFLSPRPVAQLRRERSQHFRCVYFCMSPQPPLGALRDGSWNRLLPCKL